MNEKNASKLSFEYPELISSNIKHAFFTRNIPNSTHRYVSYGLGEKLHLDSLQKNREIIASFFGLDKSNLYFLKQIHSNKVAIVNEAWSMQNEPSADSLVTNKPNCILAIQTADCAPVLFSDPVNKVIAAAHAGWRGARAGIIENTISNLIEMGARKETLTAAIGPCIHQDNYEVSQDFYDHFLKETFDNEIFFKATQFNHKYYFNLPGYIEYKLKKFGIKIFNHNLDTFSSPHNFFSYRHATIERKQLAGSLISAILIQN